jgi:hypothetical protein
VNANRAAMAHRASALDALAASLTGYQHAVGAQLAAVTKQLEAVRTSWAGPAPDNTMARARSWQIKTRDATSVIGAAATTIGAWATDARTLADELPAETTHGDPVDQEIRHEVAAAWARSCVMRTSQLSLALQRLQTINAAELDRGWQGLRDRFGATFAPFGEFFGGGFSKLGDLFAAFAASATPMSWGDWMSGQQPHQEDMDLAVLSNDVYDAEGWNDPHRTIGNGWTRVPADDLPAGLTMADFENAEFGNDMRAALYTDGNGHYVLAFAGTDSFSDVLTDIYQGVGLDTRQYDQARRLGQRLSDEYGDDLVMTGHSLGGGAASYAALATGTTAVTFNAAGLSDANIERAGHDWQGGREQAARGQVRAYHVESDVLTNTQEEFDDLPDAVGTPITIANPIEQPSDWWLLTGPFGAGMQGGHAVDMHLMDNVLAGMQGSDLTFSTTYSVDHGGGNVTTEHSPQTYEGGWFNR